MCQFCNFFSSCLKVTKISWIFKKYSRNIFLCQLFFQLFQIYKSCLWFISYFSYFCHISTILYDLWIYFRIHSLRNKNHFSIHSLFSDCSDCHTKRRCHCLTAVISCITYNICVQKFSHHACVFKDCLHLTMIRICISAVSSQELASGIYLIADCGHLMFVTPGSKKARIFFRCNITIQNSHHMSFQFIFTSDRFRNI